ncbi:1,3-beta-galactosyl-N-acetylhexosamine phosphorylase [Oceanivirga miroungae]|uniref:1,3-beta-galactosyl-N-acetylhexosamine phosphorylase n=1 Tax=Oceanivirga miroungae TaxID=1130046 RepID=A0A6I8M9P5_9FUSO|nr:1,3-beta-galactosyl-N-acetylhexosamine phosphorylase [Oceanivirga miroungae]VWL85016.1 1,3-beta-galactosyl-N-acetylhexosamine phosphorylase [Oceanivirga miroungae]
MNSRGRVTLPIEEGKEELVQKLMGLWGSDAIRNSDGTKLNNYFENLDQIIYATYFVARGDQKWANENPDEIINAVLVTDRNTAFSNTLKIELLKTYYKEQLEVNEDKKALDLMQVINKTTNKILDKSEYHYENGFVIIENAKKFNEYTVNFLAKQVWDITHMYNHLTNNWTGDKSTPFDAVYDKTYNHMLENMKNWLEIKTNVDVVRFTTFFYHFMVMYDNKKRQKYGDWFGYSGTVSVEMLEKFKKAKSYELTLEDIADGGYYNNQFRNPSKKFLDYVDFVNEFVCEKAKKIVDIVHEYNKKAIMFIGDNWIGIEPYSKNFKKIGLDGLVGSAECGVDVRMVSDTKDVAIKEIRFLPYFFPDVFDKSGQALKELKNNWYRTRRAMLVKNVDRIGFGGYLSLANEEVGFTEYVENICNQFREIHDITKDTKSKKLDKKVAILNSWGKLKSWQANRTGHASGNYENYKYIGALEAIAGLPIEVEFINFEDVKNKEKLNEFNLIINVGKENTAFIGGKNWLDEKVLTNIREFVYEGGAIIGIADPSACSKDKGTHFSLADIFGLDKEVGNTYQYSKYEQKYEKVLKDHYIFNNLDKNEILESKVFEDSSDFIYRLDENLDILASSNYSINIAANEYGNGRAVYINQSYYSLMNTKMLFNSILWATKSESPNIYITDTKDVEVYEFSEVNKLAVVNNTNESKKAKILYKNEVKKEISLEPNEIKWL